MRSTILSGVLVLLVFLGGCHYGEERRAEQEARAAYAEKVRAEHGDDVAAKLQVPKMKERVEDVPALSSTPTPPPDLLNLPVDPAGEPQP